MSNNTFSTEIRGFDLAKIMMAILIVGAHTQFLVEWPNARKIFSCLSAIGVPMFFAISAYLFVRKLDNSPSGGGKQILIHSVKRLCILFCVWYVLMLPMTWFRFFSVATLKETIYAVTLSCTFNGYWFIKALLINTIIVYLCRRTKSLITLTVVALLIFIFFSYNYIYHYFTILSISPYYSFYFHTITFCIGALFARFEREINLSALSPIPLIVIWGMLFITAICCKWGEPIYSIGSLIVLFPIFYNIKLPYFSPTFWKHLRTSSIIIYMVQFVLIWLYDMACEHYLGGNLLHISQHSVVRFVIVLTATALISIAIIRFEKQPQLRLLRYLH